MAQSAQLAPPTMSKTPHHSNNRDAPESRSPAEGAARARSPTPRLPAPVGSRTGAPSAGVGEMRETGCVKEEEFCQRLPEETRAAKCAPVIVGADAAKAFMDSGQNLGDSGRTRPVW